MRINEMSEGKRGSVASNMMKIAAVIGLLVAAFIIAWALSANSLPGSALYSIKTDFIEQLDKSVQLTDDGRAQAQVHLLENRLSELKALVKRDSVSPEAVATLRTITERHRATFMDTLGDLDNDNATEVQLRNISDFAGVASAMEVIAEGDPRFAEYGDYMEDIRREAVSAYRDKIDRFVERETPESIFNIITTNLKNVSDSLQDDSLSQETVNDAEMYIGRVEPALLEGDYPRALNSIAEAMRFIHIDLYGALAFSQTQSDEEVESEDSEDSATSSASTDETPEDAPATE